MKIISVNFKNIQSIKTIEKPIRFDLPPLSVAGLFAIIGATGAGKTTILDAICLALYGRVPRQNDGEVQEVMTRHTGECWSEVEFEANKKQYRAKWLLWRAGNKPQGKLQAPKMELIELPSNQIIADKITEVKQKIIEITGLDYPRFMRSVMLSQGDFAAFLKADPKDRGELLERITGTELYSEISKLAHEKEKEEKNKLDTLTLQTKINQLLSANEIEIIQQQLEDKNKIVSKLSNNINELHTQKNTLSLIKKINEDLKNAQNEYTELQTNETLYFDLNQKINKYNNAINIQTPHNDWKRMQDEITKLHTQIEILKQSNKLLTEELSTLNTNKKSLKQLLENQKEIWVKSEPAIKKTIEIDNQIAIEEATYNTILNQNTEKEKQIQALNTEIAAIYATQQQFIFEKQTLENTLKQSTNYQYLTADIPVLNKLFVQLKTVDEQINNLNKELNTALISKDNATNTQKKVNEQLSLNKVQGINIQTAINEVEKKANKLPNYQELENEISKTQQTLNALHRQEEYSLQFEKKSEQKLKLLNNYFKSDKELKELQKQLSKNELELLNAKQCLNDLNEIYHREVSIAKYETDRNKLKTGTECPLCGSVHHPFLQGKYLNKLSETEQRKKTQENLIEDLNNTLQINQKTIASLQTNLNNTKENGENLKKEIDSLKQQFNDLQQYLPFTTNIQDTANLQQLCQQTTTKLGNLQNTLDTIKDTQNELNKQNQALAICNQKMLQLQNEILIANNEVNNIQNQILTNQNNLHTHNNNKQLILAECNTLLSKYTIDYDVNTPYALTINKLNTLLEQYKNNINTQTTINTQLLTLETQNKALQQSLENETVQNQNIKTQLQTVAQKIKNFNNSKLLLIANFIKPTAQQEHEYWINQITTTEKNIVNIENQQTAVETKLNHQKELWVNASFDLENKNTRFNEFDIQFKQKIEEQGFKTVIEIENALAISTQINELKQKHHTWQLNLNKTNTEINQLKNQLKNYETQNIKPETQILEELTQLEAQKSEIEQEIGKAKQQISANNILQQTQSQILKKTKAQQTEWQRWAAIKELIGSHDGAKFSKFAQDLTLKQLVILANLHLKKLNDRYQIKKHPEKELELEIIDRYQSDVARSVKTLSGGESFLVSLSLALGLSELAGKRTPIESLFIDEGFGTLDANTLDIAIATLENLQSKGKTIGIISHVEALKERITTQIQVIKQSGGSSIIKIVG